MPKFENSPERVNSPERINSPEPARTSSPERINSPVRVDSNIPKQKNLRKTFRIIVSAQVEYHSLANNEQPLSSLFDMDEVYALQEIIDNANESIQGGLAKLTRTDPLVAELLTNFNDKLDALSHHIQVVCQQPGKSENLSAFDISLSTEGLSFMSAHRIEKGSILAMHLILPIQMHILCYGEVLRCVEINDKWEVALGYKDLEKNSERRLSRYILEHQINQKSSNSG